MDYTRGGCFTRWRMDYTHGIGLDAGLLGGPRTAPWRTPIRTVGVLALSLCAFLGAFARIPRHVLRSGVDRPGATTGPAGRAADSGDRAPVPIDGIQKVLVRPGGVGPAAVFLPPGAIASRVHGVFLYSDVSIPGIPGMSLLEEGWVYGAKLEERLGARRVAVPTGRPEDVIKGQLVTLLHSNPKNPLQDADNAHGFNPRKTDMAIVRRGLVEVVVRDGTAYTAYWYYEPIERSLLDDSEEQKDILVGTKGLPALSERYKSTNTFTQDVDIPMALLAEHSTGKGVWGKIVVEEGKLNFKIDDQSWVLESGISGVAQPQQLHSVAPLAGGAPVKFHVDFYRLPHEEENERGVRWGDVDDVIERGSDNNGLAK
eukprot:g49335.t1